jgi:branched-chain amino acid transport system permease protein
MAAIGGFCALYGPIIGAVLVTLMNSSLSNYTNASEFYIGLVFLSIVTFASRGMAGGLEQGWAALRGGHVRQRIPGWLVQWLGVLLIILGLIAFVETIYQVQNGPDVVAAALGISFNPRVIWSWIVILVLCGGGYGILRLARRAYAADEPDETGGTPTHA